MKKTITLFFLSLTSISMSSHAMRATYPGYSQGQTVTQFLSEKAKMEKQKAKEKMAEERENYLVCLQTLMELEYKTDSNDNNKVMSAFKRILTKGSQCGIIFTEKNISSIECGPDKQPLLHAIVTEQDTECLAMLLQHNVDVDERDSQNQSATALALKLHKANTSSAYFSMAMKLSEYNLQRTQRKLKKSASLSDTCHHFLNH